VRVLEASREMTKVSLDLRAKGEEIALVPTMGALHGGHVSLLERARGENNVLVMSLFVNPTQFAPGEDYEAYPRDRAGDLGKAQEAGVDLVFAPTVEEMYPPRDKTPVRVDGLSERLCGVFRPGHFQGVTAAVAKLFEIVRPHRAYFGKKDYQQWVILRRMTQDLGMEVEVIGCPTVRDPDGLATSSRNVYLSEVERAQARALPRALRGVQEAVRGGDSTPVPLVAEARRLMKEAGLQVEYVALVHPETLEDLEKVEGPAVVLAAVWCGRARLIDNMELGEGEKEFGGDVLYE